MTLTYLADLWDDSVAATLDEPELLRYRSNLLGSDPRLTNYGGGNTSAKLPTLDPLTGETVPVLWVKGSGGDLGTIRRDGFAVLYQDKLESLIARYKGPEFEDEMVDLYPLCAFGPASKPPSIDTPLHAFLPFAHVDHLHPDWAIALAAHLDGEALLRTLHEKTGVKLVWLPWKRPGFELGLWLRKAYLENPDCDGIVLGSHGLFTWGNTGKESYRNTLRVLDAIGRFVVPAIESQGASLFGGPVVETRPDRAELLADLLPALRGALKSHPVAHIDTSETVLAFVNSANAPELAARGTSCPDHFLRTKVKPLFVNWDAKTGDSSALIDATLSALPSFAADYAAYYDENRRPDSPALRATDPGIVLIPGVGLIAFSKNKTEARITSEFYVNAIHVMAGATSVPSPGTQAGLGPSGYVSLPASEAFAIEYWLLEEAKLKRQPPAKELAKQIVLVVGTGSGIGRAVAERLARDGAVVACADIRPDLAAETVAILNEKYGKDTAISVGCDCTNRESTTAAVNETVRAFGGLDLCVVVAAVFFPPDGSGRITEAQWRATFDVNTLGSYVAADEAAQVMRKQGGGSVVLISSANAVVAKAGSFAYDASKAALNHLVRELAVAHGPSVRVNGVAPASVVAGSLQFPRDRVLSSLAKYDVAFDESDDTETLREKLSDFYARRTILRKRVTPESVAEAVFLLASPIRLPLTTGQMLPVDAGLPEAFLR